MPCTYTGSIEGDRALAATEKAERLAEIITELTRHLCEACAALEEAEVMDSSEVSEELVEWWKAHKEQDERAQALKKLTPRERKLLKID